MRGCCGEVHQEPCAGCGRATCPYCGSGCQCATEGQCRSGCEGTRRLGPTGYCRVCLECGPRELPPAPDKLVARWPMGALSEADATRRLLQASAEIAEIRSELASDARRASQAAAHREQGRALQAEAQEISRQLVVADVDDLELAHIAPGLYRERHRPVVMP
jgi:hypothetical protein